MSPLSRRMVPISVAAVLAIASAVPAVAQEEVATSTISAIERGEAPANVYLLGAALEQVDDDEYLFSDGTGVITIDVDEPASEDELPLFELIGIGGTVDSGEVDVTRWELLPIVTPAVIIEEPQVIDAFRGWIIAYGSQAPE